MTWEETILKIRNDPSYQLLVEQSYLEEDLELNVRRFRYSAEFKETLRLLKACKPPGNKLLDLGCGNGISSVSLALEGFQVTAVDPDPSETIGTGALRLLADRFELKNLKILTNVTENLKLEDGSFDIVYCRQSMHHAQNLTDFVRKGSGALKKGGIFMTVRDHVIFDETDKEWFLENHPLHGFYGGENAFQSSEYRKAFSRAGLFVLKELKHYDNVINYYPITQKDLKTARLRKNLLKLMAPFLRIMGKSPHEYSWPDEKNIPGRMYSYICVKNE